MAKSLPVFFILALTFQAQGNPGQEACNNKKFFMKNMCQTQKLVDGTAYFSKCNNGFSYYLVDKVQEADFTITSGTPSCKIVEVRNEKSIEKKTTYFNQQAQRIVVYEHTNGLANTFIYGHTGYYHVSEVETGDSLYNFYSYNN